MIGTRQRAYRIAKRAFDFAFAAALLLVSSPLLALIAVAIKLTDGGPVLYWQERVGMWGEVFAFPKFRSMIPKADQLVDTLMDHNHHGNSITFKIKRDPRVTWIGRLIRRYSLDEFPQLWCVLCGQMSLVGPRPALPREVDNYTQAHRRRLGVCPGLTCIWQVSGRGDVPFEKQVEMDVEYVESHSFWLDVKLVACTVPAVLSGRGAY
jgi:lipopolysaccharide/colanic/teichoic acid biosynthesis glycosyltransferase